MRNYRTLLLLLTAALISARADRIVLEQSQDFDQGKLKAAALSSKGKILSGRQVEEIKLDEAAIWSMLELKPDQLLLGTGNKARLYLFEKGKPEQIFEDQGANRFAIPVIAKSAGGDIFFAAVPKAAVYQLAGKTAKKLAEPGADYIWTLLPLQNGVLAGGGPKGKIFLIKPDGKSDKILELNAEQVIDIVPDGQGGFLAGTAKPAMLISFKLDGTYQVVASFAQEELRAIRVLSDKSLVLALNQGGLPQMAAPEQEVPPPGMDGGEEGQEQEGQEDGAPPQIMPPPAQIPGGRSIVYRFYPDHGLKQLLTLKQATILSLFGDEQSGFFAGTDDQGKVYQILPGQDEYWLSFDLEPGKVVSFAGAKGALHFIGTAQPARLYRVLEASGTASYETKTLDAQFSSHWGRIEWRGKGSIKFSTRSGNTTPADVSWSKWEIVEGPELKIKSPAGRFLQARAEWNAGDKMEIDRIEISYQNLNQAEYIVELKVNGQGDSGGAGPMPGGEGMMPPSAKSPASVLKQASINWRIDNSDADPLYLELFYKQEGAELWVPIAKGDDIKGNRWQWDASGLQDGWYRVKLTVSDNPNNLDEEAFAAEQISSLILIDTTGPELTFTVNQDQLAGTAKDLTSDIAKLEFAIDDGDFRPTSSLDQVLDQPEEKFSVKLKKLDKGTHRLTVRACDQANNCSLRAQEFTVK